MENNNKKNEKIIEENGFSINIQKEKSFSTANTSLSSMGIKSESLNINSNEIENNYKNDNGIKMLLNKVINVSQTNLEKNLIFECPEQNCPFIPFLTYFEFTQSIATKCRMGHEYHLSLKNYYEIIFIKINTEKYCNICLKKNYSNIKSSSELYCINCHSYLCKRCQIIHNKEHQILEISKINTYCPIHEKTKFSGFCSKCQKDICIHCLKDHSGVHHCLVKYLELIPNKENINNYRNQIKNEIKYIDSVKSILFDNNFQLNNNEKNMILEFFDKMKLKYYFYEEQLQTFDKIKFNICIIKNVLNLFLIPQNFFKEIYTFINSNLNEYNKFSILNKLMSSVLKYHNTKKMPKKKANKYLSHFEFNPLFSLNKNKNIKFIYSLKCGKFIVCLDNDGLYVYDDGTFVELLHIPSESDIIDLCEDESGLLFLLKKPMIEIIKINENYSGYTVKNKIIFKTIDKANFICSITNGSIIVSRIKRNDGNLEIWMKSKINNNNMNNQINIKDKKTKNRLLNDLPERGRNIINMFNNNNRRLEIVLRRTINNNNVININNNINNNNNINSHINNNINTTYINNNINTNINNNNNTNINNNKNINFDNNNNNNINIINNENNNGNNLNNNENNNEEEENNEDNENIENNINNDINNDNNNNNNQININDNNIHSIMDQNNNDNDNIILEEIPQFPQIINNPQNNNNSNINNNIIINNTGPNNNSINIDNNNVGDINLNNNNNYNLSNNIHNNNSINLNIIRGNRVRHRRQNQDIQRPRFVHVIRFIRDQLQGLVNNLQQEELVLEDPSLISSVGIYGSKDQEITHINKIVKNGHEICSLLDWDYNYFICSEFHVQRKTFNYIRIYSSETYEPCGNNGKIKIKNCSRDKNALIKIDNDIFGVCYDIEKTLYGLSLVSFKTREEISKIEMPKFNLVKKINFHKFNYLFVLLDYFGKNNINHDMIKVYKIMDKELVDSSSYYFESWLNTYVYNKKNEKNKNDNNEIKFEEEEKKKDKELKFMNIVNSFEQNNHYGKEIVSMIKLKNNAFVFLNKSHCINFYKVE